MTTRALNWLVGRADQTPDGFALRCDGERLTFRQLSTRVDETAVRLFQLGVRAGDRVGILATGLDFVYCLHALTRLGAVAVPLNTRLLPVDHGAQLTAVNAAVLLVGAEGEATAERIAADQGQSPGPAYTISPEGTGDEARCRGNLRYVELPRERVLPVDSVLTRTQAVANPAALQAPDLSGLQDTIYLDAIHSIIFTSGTTGEHRSGAGKPVKLTHANHWWNAFGSALNLGATPDDVWLDCLSLYHVGGLSMLVKSVLYGVPVVLHTQFDPDAVNSDVDSGQVTIVSLVSTMLHRLIERRKRRPFPASLRCILLGGGPIPRSLVQTCLEVGVPIAPTWGMTETASQAATLRPEELAAHHGSAGRALIGVDIAVDVPAFNAQSHDPGEIIVRGPSVTPGYIRSAGPGRAASRTPISWFHTGDLGFVDGDGYLVVTDRRTDLIVSGGENVFPSEVEDVLGSHPDVSDVAVFGLPDPEWGQIVAAAIVPGSEDVVAADLTSFCRARLATYKCPKVIRFVPDLPRTSSGKLRRMELMAGY